jgi:hypothetical protein
VYSHVLYVSCKAVLACVSNNILYSTIVVFFSLFQFSSRRDLMFFFLRGRRDLMLRVTQCLHAESLMGQKYNQFWALMQTNYLLGFIVLHTQYEV